MLATRRMVYKLLSRDSQPQHKSDENVPKPAASLTALASADHGVQQTERTPRSQEATTPIFASIFGSLKTTHPLHRQFSTYGFEGVPARCAQVHPGVSRMTNQRTLFG